MRCSAAIVAALLLAATAAVPVVASSAIIGGTVTQGISQDALRRGGETLTIMLPDAASYRANLSPAEVRLAMIDSVSSASGSQWNLWKTALFAASSIEIAKTKKSLRVVFAPIPNYNCSAPELITVYPPVRLINAAVSGNSTFVVVPHDKMAVSQVGDGIAGEPFAIRVFGKHLPSFANNGEALKFVSGTDCRGTALGYISDFDANSHTLHVVINQGAEKLSLCYVPPDSDAVNSMITAVGSLSVAGPQTFSATGTDGNNVLAEAELPLEILGYSLTPEDTVTLIKLVDGASCESLTVDQTDVQLVRFVSTTKVTAVVSAAVSGDYAVCYLRRDAQRFVRIQGKLRIANDANQRGGLLLDAKLVLKRDFLTTSLEVVRGAELHVDSHRINVSRFVWEDGEIIGQGKINVRHEGNITGPAKRLNFEIVNWGTLHITASSLVFGSSGRITNFGTVFFTLSNEMTTVDTSQDSIVDDWIQKIVNQAKGHFIVDSLLPSHTLRLRVPITNFGHFDLRNGQVWLSIFTGSLDSTLRVAHPARMVAIKSFDMAGTLTVHGAALVALAGKTRLDRSRIACPQGGNVVVHTDGMNGATMDSVQVKEQCRFYVQGVVAPRGSLPVAYFIGYNTFGPNTTLLLKNVEISGSANAGLTMSSIIANGHVICNVSSVRFGNNLILSALMRAVLFGNGAQDQTVLVPQVDPVNATLTIPMNASLVLLDVNAKPKSSAGAHLCAQYLVIPVHVLSHGSIRLWGCATLPFGGSHHGEITSEGNFDSIVNAYMQYAMCQETVHGQVTDDIAKRYSPGVCIPVFQEAKPVSGLLLAGAHDLHSGGSDRPMIVADSLTVTRGTLEASRSVVLDLARELLISDSAALSLLNGGRIRAPLSELRGQIALASPVAFDGDVSISGQLEVEFSLDRCAPALSVTGDVTIHPGSSVGAYGGPVHAAEGDSTAVIRANKIAGLLGLDDDTLPSGTTIDNGDGITLLRFLREQPTPRNMLSASIGAVSLSIALLGVWLLVVGPGRFVKEFLHQDAVAHHLSWPEFSAFTFNHVILSSFVLEAFLLGAVAFHQALQHPPGFDGLTNSFRFLFGLNTFTVASKLTSGLLIFTIGAWLLVWLPFFGRTRLAAVTRFLEDQGYVVHLLNQANIIAAWGSVIFFVPIVSTLLEGPLCATILAHKDTCNIMQPMAWPSFIALIVFLLLAPYSGASVTDPFCHWPHTRDVDLRSKRTVTYVRCCLLFTITALWKILGHDLGKIIVCTAVLVALLFVIEWFGSPCVFGNINLLRRILFIFPCIALLAAQMQIWRARTRQICAPSDPIFAAMLAIGLCATIASAIMAMRRSGRLQSTVGEFRAIVDPVALDYKRSLMLKWAEIEKERMRMYSAASRADRDAFSRELQKKRLEYLQELNKYRYQREGHARKYYLGQLDFEVSSAPRQPDDIEMNQSPSESLDSIPMREALAKKNNTPVTDADIDSITPAQMASFNQGPVLGRGTYGIVYMGLLTGNKIVAVKIIPVSKKHKTESISAVRREVDVLRTLRHPNIIQFYGCHTNKKEIFIVMELANHGSLTQLARKFGRLSETNVRQYASQMLSGLAYLHGRGIVHRDIKGENVLIDGNGVAKLGDFGCSKALAEAANQSQQGCASLVGSPYWMAPEVIRSEAYGTKADVWSLGCTVVEMLNGGQPPWNERFDNVYSAMFFIGNSTELPSNIPSDASASCREFLSRCFERDASKRASVNELLSHPWLSIPQDEAVPAVAVSAVSDAAGGMKRGWSEMFESDSEPASRPATLSRQATDDTVGGSSSSMQISSQDGGEHPNPTASPATSKSCDAAPRP